MKYTHSILAMAALALSACSSNAPKADIADTANPQEEITKLEQKVSEARNKNVDVLDSGDFKDGVKWLDEAKKDASNNKKQNRILDDLRKGTGYLNRANQIADQRAPLAPAILSARQAALAAGANKFSAQQTELENIDSDFIDEAGKLDRLDTKDFTKLQTRYLDLELAAIEQTQLGQAHAMITAAKKDNAEDKAPVNLRRTEIDLTSAENVISTHRSDRDAYLPAVTKANASADFLNQVMKEIKANKGLKESAATELVQQHMQIASLNKNLDATKAQTAAASAQLNAQLSNTKAQLSDTDAKLKGATAQVRIQQAIDTARQQFSPSEAEVFQQGDKLVVRLKSLNFTSGRSELPSASMDILAKVKDVAKGLDPKEVVVEGHTDSVGTAEINQNLSMERAKMVASYLGSAGIDKTKIEAKGYGFDKPIASNKTKTGRAQNRRVDVVITPAATAEVAPPSVGTSNSTNTESPAAAAAR